MIVASLRAWRFVQGRTYLRRRFVSFLGNLHERHGMALHVIKTVIAAALALFVSLAMDMASPRTAVFCVFLVMQAQTGLVFQKSFYRLLGTVVGAFVGIILIGTLGQTPEMFFLCFGLWIAFCTSGSLFYRNFQSYGFVLAGYTVCFVAFPSIDDPSSVFQTGVTRVLEMFVGVFCAAAVSDTLFPDRMFDTVIQQAKSRFRAFCDFLVAAPRSLESAAWARDAMLKFTGDVLSLASAQASTSLESNAGRQFGSRIQLLNHDFMKLTTSIHALHALLRRLSDTEPVKQALMKKYSTAIQTVLGEGSPNYSANEVLSHLETQQSPMVDVCGTGNDAAWDFRTGSWLLLESLDAFRIYCKQQLRLESLLDSSVDTLDAIKPTADQLRFTTKTDPLVVLVSVARALGVLLVTTLMWTLTGWPLGYQAIMTGVATGTLFASLPAPSRMFKQVILGWLAAFPLALFWNFWVLPMAFDVVSLTMLLLPPFALIAWLANSRRWAAVGIGLFICFILNTSIDHEYRGDITSFVDLFIADFFGFAIPSALYLIIDLTQSRWVHQRQVKQLRQQLVEICTGTQGLSRERLESASRDLVQKIATQGRISDESDAWIVNWLLSVLELGWAIIDLREMTTGERAALVRPLLSDLADLFQAPSAVARNHALASTESTLQVIEQSPLDSIGNQIRLRLLLIRSALINASSVMADAGDGDA